MQLTIEGGLDPTWLKGIALAVLGFWAAACSSQPCSGSCLANATSASTGTVATGTSGTTGTGSGGTSAGTTGGSSTGSGNSTTGGEFVTAPHGLMPQVTLQSGRVLSPMRLVTIVAQGDPLATSLFGFGDALVQSSWLQSFSDDYGIGEAGPSVHVTGAPLSAGSTLDDAQMEAYIGAAIDGGPAPNGNTVYMLYLPDAVAFYYAPQGGTNTNCQYTGGYHRAFGSLGDGWGVAQRCAPSFNQSQLDTETLTSSHEIAEATTDTANAWALTLEPGLPPWDGSAWLEVEGNTHAEIGDLCGGSRILESGFLFQRIFSNTAAAAGGDACVPALSVPYFNVTTTQDWYTAQAGQTIQIPFTGWSTAPTGDWIVRPFVTGSSSSALAFTTSISSASSTTIGGYIYSTLNNGQDATLSVTVPTGAVSGDWVAASINSKHTDSSFNPLPGEDDFHRWMVGVYVP